jgi:hypothetical protein
VSSQAFSSALADLEIAVLWFRGTVRPRRFCPQALTPYRYCSELVRARAVYFDFMDSLSAGRS